MRLEVWRDGDAWAQLGAQTFREQWERLYAECPWASVFQSYGYAATWYDVYQPRYAPLIVGALADDGTLTGLLPLAIDAEGRPIVAGGRQAEYQGWVARPTHGDAFIEAALERLASECPGGTLTFRYLPPATPRAWLARPRGVGTRCVLVPTWHGIMEITDASVQAALRRKNYRSRLRRLERLGPVTYERVTDPREVDAVLDEIIPLCDLRHGALHGVMPFTDDPLKVVFHRALARVPGLLYVSVLRCGGEVVGAAFDADNRGEVALGFAAFSPFLSRLSPRRLQLTALANDLTQRGYRAIDLTPGDDFFKREWATRVDEGYTLHVFFSRPRLVIRMAVDAARRTAKVVLQRTGADPRRLSERLGSWARELSAAGARHAPAVAGRALRRHLWGDEVLELYRFDGDAIAGLAPGGSMRRDRISDLVAYCPGVFAPDAREVFLRTAYKRLEHDAHVFTRVDRGQLVACGWISGIPRSVEGEQTDDGIERAPDSALVYDVTMSPGLGASGELIAALGQLAREAAGLPGVGHVLVAVPSDAPDARRAAVQLGGRHAGRIYRRRRVGRTQVTSTLAAAEYPAPAAPGPMVVSVNGHGPAPGAEVEARD
jgi:CelD/BcsL family acetyltransferase involved in cellulose biosynthesis